MRVVFWESHIVGKGQLDAQTRDWHKYTIVRKYNNQPQRIQHRGHRGMEDRFKTCVLRVLRVGCFPMSDLTQHITITTAPQIPSAKAQGKEHCFVSIVSCSRRQSVLQAVDGPTNWELLVLALHQSKHTHTKQKASQKASRNHNIVEQARKKPNHRHETSTQHQHQPQHQVRARQIDHGD